MSPVWENGSEKLSVIKGNGIPVFILSSEEHTIQIGTSPEFHKRTIAETGTLPDYFIVPPPAISLAGDNWTGFEFPLWQARFMDFLNPHLVALAGYTDHVNAVYQRLSYAMFGDYVTDVKGNPQSHWVPKKWVDDVLSLVKRERIEIGKWVFTFTEEDIDISCGDKSFSWRELFSKYVYERDYDLISGHEFQDQNFGVLVAGNGVGSKNGNTSSFVVKIGDEVIWVDPPAYPVYKSAELGIAAANVNALVITHVHEDHIEGFSSWYYFLKSNSRSLPLYTTPTILRQLKAIFEPLGVEFDSVLKFHNISELENKGTWKFRTNYHTIPTVGFKVTDGENWVGVSGDTIYNEALHRGRYLNREISYEEMIDLSFSFFKECKVIFHDTNVVGDPVHTPLALVEQLNKKLPRAAIYAYHLFEDVESDYIKKSEVGKFYIP